MSATTFKLSGFRELEDALLKLSTGTARRHGTKALREAGEPILGAYKARTTVKSGRLVQNETLGPRSRLNRRQKSIAPKPGPSEVEIHIGTSDPAGIQEEFGGRQAANPSLTPAWDQHGGQKAIDIIGKSLGASIEKSARRKGR